MKYRHWWVLFPGEVYANDMRFDTPITEPEWKEWLRGRWKMNRLPRGTQVWGYR